ncbi:hypothetical protein ASH00_14325 [Arthrobacter sp. Soil782]|uniref:glycosyltransferase n=1 Tax=Arthrobacter sp. Soil782 TaxID=1736410 RepID=UPI0006F9A8EA|nr:hypothetical protein ASH00_14325 [Arthrobacter sp. Soil782]
MTQVGGARNRSSDVAVDLVIAVHTLTRPIGRAVESLSLSGLELNKPGGLRITVVCHNVQVADISPRISANLRDQVRYMQLDDGIHSPAGPLNFGLDAATAPYVAVMGSDDYLESRALRNWLRIAEDRSSDVVIAPQRHANGRKVRTPVHRVGRTRKLDPVRDRLTYRTAPLGLIRTSEMRRLKLTFVAGLPTGEDQEFSAKLWFGGGRIDYAAGAPRYVVGADANDRVTCTRRSVEDTLRFASMFVDSDWFTGRSLGDRRSMVAKLVRVHIFGLLETRSESGGWSGKDRYELASILRAVLASAEGSLEPFSRADCRVANAILDPEFPQERLMELARARRAFLSPTTFLPMRIKAAMTPESPLRFLPAAALLR